MCVKMSVKAFVCMLFLLQQDCHIVGVEEGWMERAASGVFLDVMFENVNRMINEAHYVPYTHTDTLCTWRPSVTGPDPGIHLLPKINCLYIILMLA